MKAILIDPFKKEIREVQTDGTLSNIYQLLDCNMIESPVEYDNRDILYCDEEAWLYQKENIPLAGFKKPGWSYPILGKALIIGTDDNGESTDCKSKVLDFFKYQFIENDEMLKFGKLKGII